MNMSKRAESLLYAPLEHHDSFRLLRMRPHDSGDKWLGTLAEERLPQSDGSGTATKYIAISYVWGDPTFNVPGEESIEISLSLSTALGHFLSGLAESGPVNIWIDQICINQRECNKKKHQVSLMWRIFAEAEQVIGWLGPGFKGSDHALAELTLLAGASDEASGEEFAQVARRLLGQHFVLDDVLLYIGNIMRLGSDVRGRMLQFFGLPWFQRCWIAQEACLATSLRIHCGHQSISGAQLFSAISAIQTIVTSSVSPRLQRPFRNAFALLKTREMVRYALGSNHHTSFRHTLQTLSFLECREDQDRINALFGIVQSSNSWFTPAYCPAPELYVNFALAHMQHYQSFDIIHFAGTTEPTHHGREENGEEIRLLFARPANDLPSWVPDWRIRHRYLPIIPAEVEVQSDGSKHSTFALPFDPSRKSLTLSGKLLNTPIKPCGLPYLDDFEPAEDPKYQFCIDWWFNCLFVNFLNMLDRSWASQYMSSDNFTHWFDAIRRSNKDVRSHLLRFARTLIMNGMVRSYERPDVTVTENKVWEYFLAYARLHLVAGGAAAGEELTDAIENYEGIEKAVAYGYLAEHVCRYRTLFLGNNNVVGLGSPGICPGDRICFFHSLSTPFVVRPIGEVFQLRGECYVDGLMDSSFDQLEGDEREIVLQ